MNLTEIYINVFFENFFKELQEEYPLNEEANPALQELLKKADELVFKKFGINPSDKVYFIAGSAALYLFPILRDKLDLRSTVGDLDIVIPDPKYWKQAGLEGQTVYRPGEDKRIEAFIGWDPSKAGGEYANVSVRSTSDILKDSFQSQGYWFMSLIDIFDYKMKLGRPKEKDILDKIKAYQEGTIADKIGLLRQLLSYYKKEDIKATS
jgi:hypothetical protein